MTPIWHDGPLETLPRGAAPVIWSIADTGAEARAERVRSLVAHLAAVPAAAVGLSRSAAGAPRVTNPAGWHVGLTRRGGTCLIAAAMQPIAIDRETVDDAPPLWDMLTAAEAAELRALPPAERPLAWLRRWTIKEAHAKLIGEPRRIAPEGIATRLIDPVQATAAYEGRSHCWTRMRGNAIETVALWNARR